jgi:hypothetical protein
LRALLRSWQGVKDHIQEDFWHINCIKQHRGVACNAPKTC